MNQEVQYILSLKAVRERANHVLNLAKDNHLNHFDYHEDRLNDAVQYVAGIIKRDYGPNKFDQIPPHGRWQHFQVGSVDRIGKLLSRWESAGYNKTEQARGLVDLFFVSVLLDAGAGDKWRFTEPDTGLELVRSEGIAVATLHMFLKGQFSTAEYGRQDVVLGTVLGDFTEEALREGFQITEDNPFVGVAARVDLLRSLGRSLLRTPEVFGEFGRPGSLVDHLESQAGQDKVIDFANLWSTLQNVLLPIWPKNRTQLSGHPVGDAWPLKALSDHPPPSSPYHDIQPFHKLTQWLAYSLMVPFEGLLSMAWKNAEVATGLPEYRNGGVFIDMGVLTMKPEALARGVNNSGGELPAFDATSDEIVEWRALTVALLDRVHEAIQQTDLAPQQLTLPQVLEAGTWKAGRELAAEKRPGTRSSPILILGDGTLF